MYDLLDRIYTDITIQPARKENKNKAFCDIVDRYVGEEKTIFIADRGYESYNNIAHVLERNSFYLFRAKDINSSSILSGLKRLLPVTNELSINEEPIELRKHVREQDKEIRRFKGEKNEFLEEKV